MGNQNRKIKDEVAALTLQQALDESFEWLEITKRERSYGWEQTFPMQEKLLRDIQVIVLEIGDNEKDVRYGRTKVRLSLYCEKLRRHHEGMSPIEINRRRSPR